MDESLVLFQTSYFSLWRKKGCTRRVTGEVSIFFSKEKNIGYLHGSMEELRECLLKTPRIDLVDICSKDVSAVKICGTESFVEEYNMLHPPRSVINGRGIIRPMYNLSVYGKITDFIGQGSQGSIEKIEGTDGSYAVKSYHQDDYSNGIEDSIIVEIAILRRLDHPNIIRLIDIVGDNFMDINADPRIIIELAIDDLHEFIVGRQRGMVYTDLIKSYMYQLSRGLLYLHDNDIIHRDIKPLNILVLGDGSRVAITDFGSATAGFVPGSVLQSGVQNPGWRSPEILLHSETYGKEIDVFSMGVIFAELFIGKYLFSMKENVLLEQIEVLGHMTEDEWPEIIEMEGYDRKVGKFASHRKTDRWKLKIQNVRDPEAKIYMSDEALEIVKEMTFPNPSKRVTMRKVLFSPYFDGISEAVEADLPFQDNGPYVCGSNMDSSRLTFRGKQGNPASIEWLIDRKSKFKVSSITISHSKLLLDRMGNETSKCTSAACLLISSKMFELTPPVVENFVKLGSGSYDKDQLLYEERKVLKTVNFDLCFPTTFEYMYHALGGLDWSTTEEWLSDLFCLIEDQVDVRLDGYSLAYIILGRRHNFPRCFYDEFYSLKKITDRADSIISQIKRLNSKVAVKLKSKREIKKILEKW